MKKNFFNPGLTEIVKDFVARFPTIPSRRIAIWINEKCPEYTVEQLRASIRYYRGARGVLGRETAIKSGVLFEQKYDLPLPSTYDSSDFVIPEKVVLILADLQVPFHDLQAINPTIEWAKNYSKKHHRIEAVLLNGDVLDMYQLSTFSRDPRERDIQEEVDDLKDFLDMLKEEFGVPIYWKFGNHEDRFERYIYQHAQDLVCLRGFTDLDNLFRLKDYNCTTIKDKRIIKIGHLNVIHGHEFKGGMIASVNPARTFFLKAKAPTLGGDRHMTSEHSGRTIDGKLITCWSVGCLSQLKPKWLPLNEWNHGFALVRVEGNTFHVLNMRIENGVVY